MSKNRFLAWTVAALLAVVAVCGACYAAYGTYDVVLTQAQLQQKIDARMPYQGKGGVNVNSAQLDLAEDRINLRFSADTVRFGKTYELSARTTGDIIYRQGEGKFYFDPAVVKVESVAVNGANVAQKLEGLLDRLAKSEKAQVRKEFILEKADAMLQSTVQKATQAALSLIPVYQVKDDFKGMVVKQALTSVTVSDGKVIAQVSVWQLTYIVLSFAFIGLIAIAMVVAMLHNPELFMVFAVFGALGS